MKTMLTVAVAFGIALGAIGMVILRGCEGDSFNPGQPPERFDEENIEINLPPSQTGAMRRVTHRTNPVRKEGVAHTEAAQTKAEKFAASVMDSTLPAELPEVRLRHSQGILDLAIGDSKGNLHRSVTSCPDPCEAGVRDNKLFSESPRALFRWNWQKDLRDCAIWTGAGAGVGATKDAPLEGAIGGLAICGGYKIVKARL